MTTLTTRAYLPSDWSAAERIHDLARPIELAGSCDPRAFVALANDAEDLAQFHECDKIVGCLAQRVVGFIGVLDQEIGWLYVDPAESRKGLGRTLLRAGLATIDGPANVHVLEGNAPALKLYQSEGFTLANRFKSKNNGYPCTVLELRRP